MKYSTSNEKMALIHRALDEELEIIGRESKTAVARKDAPAGRAFGGGLDLGKKGVLGSIINRSPVIETIKETDIASKKTEIIELEKKLMALEKKMENLSATSEESPHHRSKQFHQLSSGSSKKGKQVAEVRQGRGREADMSKTNTEGVYRSLPEEDDASEDSEDYLEIQKIIQRKKEEKKAMGNSSSKVAVKYEKSEARRERKESVEADAVLKPKYPAQKTKNVTTGKNKHKRDSSKSNKSSNRDGPKLQRVSSKNSTKSQNSLKKQVKQTKQTKRSKQSPKNVVKPQKTRLKSENNFYEQNFQSVEMKKTGNLQKELSHYKKLTAKYREELQQYRVMEMEFKELSKNFAKSEQIRSQQKKVIEALKAKLGVAGR